MAIKSLGVIKIIDIHREDLHEETVEFLEKNYLAYKDNDNELDDSIVEVYSYFNGDGRISKWMLLKRTLEEMEELQKLLEENDAQYVRLVSI